MTINEIRPSFKARHSCSLLFLSLMGGAPIITSNRDFVIQLTLNQEPQTQVLTIDLVSIPNYMPRKRGVVHVPFSKARWIVKPLSDTRLSVEYNIDIDLGGAVPPWLVNMVAPQAPYETFKALGTNKGIQRTCLICKGMNGVRRRSE